MELLSWHRPQWQQIAESRRSGRLAHALLLAGPRGVGKRRFARRLANWLLCERDRPEPCGECRGCVQFAAASHPNLFTLAPEEDKRDISVDAVRELSERLSLTAHYGGAKVALIDPADALNSNGVNALLKTIEEPPPASHLLLLTERPMLLAATLRSRCQFLRFGVPPAEQALAWLREQRPGADADALAQAHGAPLRALQLLQAGALERHAQWQRRMLAVAAGQESPLALAQGMERATALAFLEWLLGWAAAMCKDLLVWSRAGARERPIVSGASLDRVAQKSLQAIRRLHHGAPPQLTVESVIIEFWQLCRSPIEEMRA